MIVEAVALYLAGVVSGPVIRPVVRGTVKGTIKAGLRVKQLAGEAKSEFKGFAADASVVPATATPATATVVKK